LLPGQAGRRAGLSGRRRSRYRYGLSIPEHYAVALGDEQRQLHTAAIRDIMAIKTPTAFVALWYRRFDCWQRSLSTLARRR
jgi:hypothetical protein